MIHNYEQKFIGKSFENLKHCRRLGRVILRWLYTFNTCLFASMWDTSKACLLILFFFSFQGGWLCNQNNNTFLFLLQTYFFFFVDYWAKQKIKSFCSCKIYPMIQSDKICLILRHFYFIYYHIPNLKHNWLKSNCK